MESILGYSRIDNWSLIEKNGNFVEVKPQPTSNLLLTRIVRNIALARYLIVNMEIHQNFKLMHWLFCANTRNYEANIDTDDLRIFTEEGFLENLVGHIMGKYQEAVQEINADLILVMNTNLEAIYSGKDPENMSVFKINRTAWAEAEKLGIPIIDLTKKFVKEWKTNEKKFSFDIDAHWNQHGHYLVAELVTEWILCRTISLRRFVCGETLDD